MDIRALGHYRIERRLGSGRYTLVYQALDTVRRHTVALKVLAAEAFPLGIAVPSFLERAGGASELVHPHIAWIWETGEADQTAYLAERFVNGPSLAAVLAESGWLSWMDALNIVRSRLALDGCELGECLSDALDGDFVTGGIERSAFHDVGGDALDFSGSEVRLADVRVRRAGDKGLSVGEASRIEAFRLDIEGCRMGAVSKDLSELTIRHSTLFCACLAPRRQSRYGSGMWAVSNSTT